MTERLNERSLEATIQQIREAMQGKRVKLKPTQVIVPHMTVVQVAEERGLTIEEAQEFIRETATALLDAQK